MSGSSPLLQAAKLWQRTSARDTTYMSGRHSGLPFPEHNRLVIPKNAATSLEVDAMVASSFRNSPHKKLQPLYRINGELSPEGHGCYGLLRLSILAKLIAALGLRLWNTMVLTEPRSGTGDPAAFHT